MDCKTEARFADEAHGEGPELGVVIRNMNK